jgi:predicted phosphoribosyltransferase
VPAPLRYRDRTEAGRVLAEALRHHAGQPGLIILALPRGGVPVGCEVARALRAPLDVFLVRKLGVPRHEELAFGAIATGGVRVLNPSVVRSLGLPQQIMDAVATAEGRELERRARLFRGERPFPDLTRRPVILVDDGLATGATMRAAVAAVRKLGAARVIVAVPVSSEDTARDFEDEVDEVVCPRRVEDFQAVGQWYERFEQTTDEEVLALLEQVGREARGEGQ